VQDLWATRKPPTALHLTDPQLAGVSNHQNGTSHQSSGPVSACKALGFTDQHKDWTLAENTQVWSKLCILENDTPKLCILENDIPKLCILENDIPKLCILENDIPKLCVVRCWGSGTRTQLPPTENTQLQLRHSNPFSDFMQCMQGSGFHKQASSGSSTLTEDIQTW